MRKIRSNQHVTPCGIGEIRYLSQGKSSWYVSSQIQEAVSPEQSLIHPEIFLWNKLAYLSRFDDDCSVAVSIRTLQSKCARSARTIYRYLQQLVINGFLIIKNNHVGNTKYLDKSTYFLTIPEHIFAKIQERISRKYVTISSHNPRQSESSKIPTADGKSTHNGRDYGPLYVHNPHNRHTDTVVITKQFLFLNKKNKYINKKKSGSTTTKIPDSSRSVFVNCKNGESPVSESDKKPMQEKIKQLSETVIEKKQELAGIHRNTTRSNSDKYSAGQKISSELSIAEITITNLRHRIARINSPIKISLDENKPAGKNTCVRSMMDRPGGRKLSEAQFNYLTTQLSSRCDSQEKLVSLTNEIIFSARFVGLARESGDGKFNPISKSINVALKLVKSGRWRTPLEMSA